MTADDGGQQHVADAAVADGGGNDAGLVRLYCWLITDPRCFADGGTAPGTFDAC